MARRHFGAAWIGSGETRGLLREVTLFRPKAIILQSAYKNVDLAPTPVRALAGRL